MWLCSYSYIHKNFIEIFLCNLIRLKYVTQQSVILSKSCSTQRKFTYSHPTFHSLQYVTTSNQLSIYMNFLILAIIHIIHVLSFLLLVLFWVLCLQCCSEWATCLCYFWFLRQSLIKFSRTNLKSYSLLSLSIEYWLMHGLLWQPYFI